MQASKILYFSSLFTSPTSKLVCISLIVMPMILITQAPQEAAEAPRDQDPPIHQTLAAMTRLVEQQAQLIEQQTAFFQRQAAQPSASTSHMEQQLTPYESRFLDGLSLNIRSRVSVLEIPLFSNLYNKAIIAEEDLREEVLQREQSRTRSSSSIVEDSSQPPKRGGFT
ncbi:hypothetical protein CRG98_037750 [Punica granatum]|uniref:Uncharacterized protein n=1 Tax=Punica granatum TaxID=22663 RepID=A0A2I0IDZ7_PUNGR|nr:hypothetical protein CRG98_037750 [Punica granatum]